MRLSSKGFSFNMVLFNSIYRWCIDNSRTPCILIKGSSDAGGIINLGRLAIRNLLVCLDQLEFCACFNGVRKNLTIRFTEIIAVYCFETGIGVLFCSWPYFFTRLSSSASFSNRNLSITLID